jgi:hypothetical protein
METADVVDVDDADVLGELDADVLGAVAVVTTLEPGATEDERVVVLSVGAGSGEVCPGGTGPEPVPFPAANATVTATAQVATAATAAVTARRRRCRRLPALPGSRIRLVRGVLGVGEVAEDDVEIAHDTMRRRGVERVERFWRLGSGHGTTPLSRCVYTESTSEPERWLPATAERRGG